MIPLCCAGGSSSDNNEQVPQGSPATGRGRVWCRPACWPEDIDDVHQQGWSINVRNSWDHQSRQNLVAGLCSSYCIYCNSFYTFRIRNWCHRKFTKVQSHVFIRNFCLLPTPLTWSFPLLLRLDSRQSFKTKTWAARPTDHDQSHRRPIRV